MMGTDLRKMWASQSPMESGISRTFAEVHLLLDLRRAGFSTPGRCQFCVRAQEGADMLASGAGGRFTFAHHVNLVWLPLNAYVADVARGIPHAWTTQLGLHFDAIRDLIQTAQPTADEVLTMDQWVTYVKATLKQFAHVSISRQHILTLAADLVPLNWAPTRVSALVFMRSAIVAKLVGPTLALKVSHLVLSQVCETPVRTLTDAEVARESRQDLVNALQHLHAPTDAQLAHEQEDRPAKRTRRDLNTRKELWASKTAQVVNCIQQRLTITRAKDTVKAAVDLTAELLALHGHAKAWTMSSAGELLHSRFRLAHHMLLLDGAVDRYTSEKHWRARERGCMAGVAVATDESPPSQPRFRGLRFQITVVYIGTCKPLCDWDSSLDPPLTRTSILTDINHCASKKGTDVWLVVQRQLEKLGLNAYDITSGTGDGGGENEGEQGLHAQLEALSPGYVRRRCVAHIAWRTADQALAEALHMNLDYKPLCAYLTEGITWSRLRNIAVKSRADGGLALFREGSKACKTVFGTSPASIVDGRPESDLAFLKFLRGKEVVLNQLALKDLEQRTKLAEATKTAIRSLGSVPKRLCRVVLCEVLERCLYLARWNSRHEYIAECTSWEKLIDTATQKILDLTLTLEAAARLGYSEEQLNALDHRPDTWVELAALDALGTHALLGEHLSDLLRFRQRVAIKAAAHLALLGENVLRTTWLSARLLIKKPGDAQDAAKALYKHLVTTAPQKRTSFESHIADTKALIDELDLFTKADPPVCLWHGGGRYEQLFRFLAPRFLLAPDHVLDCERVHARWQWTCRTKRSLKLHTLNAMLRLTHHLEHNYLPSHDDLYEHLKDESESYSRNLAAMATDGVALGWRSAENFLMGTRRHPSSNTPHALSHGHGRSLFCISVCVCCMTDISGSCYSKVCVYVASSPGPRP